MIPKKYRFKNFNFSNFFKLAGKRQNEFFKIWILQSNYKFPRFSIIPPVKIFRTAVSRNKIRRRIYEILRLNIDKINKADYVIAPKEKVLELRYNDLIKKILELLK